MFEKIFDLLSNPFKRMKVFVQILIIVGFMIAFSAIQGAMGIHIIKTLNENAQTIFHKSMDLNNTMLQLQGDFMNLQASYSRDVVKSTTITQSLYDRNYEPSIISKVDLIKAIDPVTMKPVEKNVALINKLMKEPISIENNEKLDGILFNIKNSLKNCTDNMVLQTAESMIKGNQFAKFATIVTLSLLIASAFLAVVFGLVIAMLIARPLKLVRTTANSLANGDLTRTIIAKGSVEVTSVIDSLNKAIRGLKELVSGIDDQAGMLYIASKELKDASNDTGRSASEIAKTMEELARTSSEQANQTSDTVQNINSLSEMVRQVSNELKAIAVDSENVAQSAKLGQKASTDVADEIEKIYYTTGKVNEVINELNNTSEEIGEISTVIEGIAEQTALLALNASIEAARAGEHGKGFAVVANETGKLADQSKQAAQHIANLITQMKTRSEQVVLSISDEIQTVESGKNLAAGASVTFGNIFDKLGRILERIEAVALSAKKMAENNDSVIAAFTNIVAMSEESMASTEEVSAAAEQQSASAQQVTALADNLAGVAGQLKQSITAFDIGARANLLK